MAISDKLNYLIETKSQLKETINYAGAGLTDETFRQYPEKLYDKYLDILKDNGEELFNGLPKATGTGTSLSMNNTANTRMKMSLTPNELEQATTGKNLFDKDNTVLINSYINDSGKWVTTGNTAYTFKIPIVENTTYTLSANNPNETKFKLAYTGKEAPTSTGVQMYGYQSYNNTDTPATITTGAGAKYIVVQFSFTETITSMQTLQMELGSTATPYEPYTNGASPNPDYPQDIHTISGDNTIYIEGKNLLDETGLLNATFRTNTYKYTPVNIRGGRKLYFKASLKPNKTALSGLYLALNDIGTNPNQATASAYVINNGIIKSNASLNFPNSQLYLSFYPTSYTYEQIQETYNLWVSTDNVTYFPYQGQQTLPLTLGTLEVCKIGDYADEFYLTNGKNLFDVTAFENQLVTGKILNDNGVEISDAGSTYSKYKIYVRANQDYHIKGAFQRAYYYDENGNFLSRSSTVGNMDRTYTPTENGYIGFQISNTYWANNKGQEQVELGNQATTFEPYGNNIWYLKKNTGKVVFDGSQDENWSFHNTLNSISSFRTSLSNFVVGNILSNRYQYQVWSSFNSGSRAMYRISMLISGANYYLYISQPNENINTLELVTQWLNDNNLSMYYQLATPTYTLLNDTLQQELNNINKALSYQDQTNISQVNDDLPFVISASAIKEYDLNDE